MGQPDRTPEQPDTAQAYVHALVTWLDRLVAEHAEKETVTARRSVERLLARSVAALTAEAFDAARAVKLLTQEGLLSDAWAASRRGFECGVIAAWLISGRGSLEAFSRERGGRSTKSLAESIRKAGFNVDPGALASAEQTLPKRTAEEEEVRRVESMCNLFHPKLYVLYRLASGRTHPSDVVVVNRFLEWDDSPDQVDRDQETSMVLWLAVSSSIWAARALDSLESGQPRRRRLKEAARAVCTWPVLYPGMTTGRDSPL